MLVIEADQSWSRTYISTTPSGSPICGFIGGTWARIDASTILLTPDQAFVGFEPRQAIVDGDEVTVPTAGWVYRRRDEP